MGCDDTPGLFLLLFATIETFCLTPTLKALETQNISTQKLGKQKNFLLHTLMDRAGGSEPNPLLLSEG